MKANTSSGKFIIEISTGPKMDRGNTLDIPRSLDIFTLIKGQVVLRDKAMFHQGGRIEELIQSAGYRLLYLPTFSPDFNLH
ncbi:transposase [Microcoleus sp. Pol12B4]|uniref:transposase n=1 Tax=Microcoleus sp. Pol12B4 TaxID=3055395 RepID=UPI002FD03BBC